MFQIQKTYLTVVTLILCRYMQEVIDEIVIGNVDSTKVREVNLELVGLKFEYMCFGH